MKIYKNRWLISFLLSTILFGCSNDSSNFSKLETLCNEMGLNSNDFNYIVMINVDACDSCSDYIKDFLAINSDDSGLLVILSSISRKKCEFILNEVDGKFQSKIDIEQKGLKSYSLVHLTPVVYVNRSGEISKHEYNLSDFGKLWLQGAYSL